MDEGDVLKTLLQKANEPVEFYKELLNIRRNDIVKKTNTSCKLLIELNNQYNTDICLLGVQALDNGLSCWDVFHILEDVIPDINHNISLTLLLFKKFNLEMQGDLAEGTQ